MYKLLGSKVHLVGKVIFVYKMLLKKQGGERGKVTSIQYLLGTIVVRCRFDQKCGEISI